MGSAGRHYPPRRRLGVRYSSTDTEAGSFEGAPILTGVGAGSGGPTSGGLDVHPWSGTTPAALALGAEPGPLPAQPLPQAGIAGVLVAPAQVGVQAAGQHGVVRVVGVVEHEVPQRPEVALDRVGP